MWQTNQQQPTNSMAQTFLLQPGHGNFSQVEQVNALSQHPQKIAQKTAAGGTNASASSFATQFFTNYSSVPAQAQTAITPATFNQAPALSSTPSSYQSVPVAGQQPSQQISVNAAAAQIVSAGGGTAVGSDLSSLLQEVQELLGKANAGGGGGGNGNQVDNSAGTPGFSSNQTAIDYNSVQAVPTVYTQKNYAITNNKLNLQNSNQNQQFIGRNIAVRNSYSSLTSQSVEGNNKVRLSQQLSTQISMRQEGESMNEGEQRQSPNKFQSIIRRIQEEDDDDDEDDDEDDDDDQNSDNQVYDKHYFSNKNQKKRRQEAQYNNNSKQYQHDKSISSKANVSYQASQANKRIFQQREVANEQNYSSNRDVAAVINFSTSSSGNSSPERFQRKNKQQYVRKLSNNQSRDNMSVIAASERSQQVSAQQTQYPNQNQKMCQQNNSQKSRALNDISAYGLNSPVRDAHNTSNAQEGVYQYQTQKAQENDLIFCMVCEEYMSSERVDQHSKVCRQKMSANGQVAQNQQAAEGKNTVNQSTTPLGQDKSGTLPRLNEKLRRLRVLVQRLQAQLLQSVAYEDVLHKLEEHAALVQECCAQAEDSTQRDELIGAASALKVVNKRIGDIQDPAAVNLLTVSEKIKHFVWKKSDLIATTEQLLKQRQSEEAALPISQHSPQSINNQHQNNENISWDLESISEIGYARASPRKGGMPPDDASSQLSSQPGVRPASKPPLPAQNNTAPAPATTNLANGVTVVKQQPPSMRHQQAPYQRIFDTVQQQQQQILLKHNINNDSSVQKSSAAPSAVRSSQKIFSTQSSPQKAPTSLYSQYKNAQSVQASQQQQTVLEQNLLVQNQLKNQQQNYQSSDHLPIQQQNRYQQQTVEQYKYQPQKQENSQSPTRLERKKKGFFDLAVQRKRQLPEEHPARHVLIAEMYERAKVSGVHENAWQQFIDAYYAQAH